MFGYARCSNCPIVEHAVDSLKKVYKDSIIVLEYHLRLAGDTISPENVSDRATFYNIGNAVPVTMIQGIYRIDGAENDVPSQLSSFQDYFNSLKEKSDSVGLKALIDTVRDSVEFTFDIDSFENVDTLREILIVLLTEDSVKFIQSGASDTFYNNVVRFYKEFSGVFPFKFKISQYTLKNRNFVAILQDTVTKNIVSELQRRF